MAVHIVGHRGAGHHAPENTLRSFRKAIAMGCDLTEFDVHQAMDGALVVIHDESVTRTTNGEGFIEEMTLDEIQTLDAGEGERVPTLNEVLVVTKGKIRLQIELKDDRAAIPAFEVTRRYKLEHEVIFSSFSVDALRYIFEIDPGTTRMLLVRHVAPVVWEELEDVSAHILGVKASHVAPEYVEQVHGLKKEFYAFHANDEELGHTLIEIGIDYLGTDYPEWFLPEV